MEAREAILARVRDALGRSQTAPAPPVPRSYRATSDVAPGSDAALALLTDRLLDYKADAHACDEASLPAVLAGLLRLAGSIVVPPGLPTAWARPLADAGTVIRTDTREAPLSPAALDEVGAVLTAARVAVAETGTIVLDAEADQGRRAISLVPDHHVCVVRRDQVVATVPEAVAVLGRHPERPMTWIAGPSATSDIELVRVEGVHGPRRLDVVVVR
ncbi:lactate utilization protein C [Georgenia sp. SYP-B2076]|uniref:LutC/YkgG family protein n=1 Tax=Georgenia sp. SYP-B2076 TaxID=2495881 RepID=UPI000F8EAF79|nr:lactate utilization protein C [Georgenia sp. SYP-B2076]